MATDSVHCIAKLATSPDTVWATLRAFDVSWHPGVSSCALLSDAQGALLREFSDLDGQTYVEQRTYISDHDRVLCYLALSGIEGLTSYRARITVTPGEGGGALVTWHADISARSDRLAGIVDGTRAVFEAGLEALGQSAKPPRAAKVPPLDQVDLRSDAIEGTPRLSYLAAPEQEAHASTLVLFLHGIGGHADNWTPQLQALGDTYLVAALNFRGYGDSTLGFKPTQIDDYCDDILAIKDRFGAERLVLVGLSMGSWIATSFAMRHGDLLGGLVLAGGCTGMSEASPNERETFRLSREVPLSKGQVPADFAPDVVKVLAGPNASAQTRQVLEHSMTRISAATYGDALNCFCNPLETFDFARISCPVMMVTGAHDRLAPPQEIRRVSERIFDAGILARGHADLRFEVIDDAGHLCNVEQPAAFNALLARFLHRLPGAPRDYKPSRLEKRREKRLRILQVAHREFCSAGFDGVSMDRIAAEADVSKPTLYQYFGDKEGLFSAVLEIAAEQIIAPLSAGKGPLVDRLWNFSWAYADFVLREDMLSLARLILGEAGRRPDSAVSYHQNGPQRAFVELVNFVEAGVAAGELDVPDADLAASDLWSLVLSGPRDYHLHHVNERPKKSDLLRSIANGLRGFLKIYATQAEAELSALDTIVAQMKASLTNRETSDHDCI